MTSSLRVRASVVMLLGILLIPMVTSSLRGLTHVLSCSSSVEARFDVQRPTGQDPTAVLLNPVEITRPGVTTQPDEITRPAPGEPTTTAAPTTLPTTTTSATTIVTTATSTVPAAPSSSTRGHPVCGGITIDMRLTAPSPGVVRVDLPVRNSGRYKWRGTLQLTVASRTFPVDLGSIPPGQTRTRSIEVKVDTTVDRVTGELLLGP